MPSTRPWYEEWFDSPYYHLLYEYRDKKEARAFIDKLLDKLNPESGSEILDLACGSGRHSIYLNELGYKVCGCDLSKNNIERASKHIKEGLDFRIHDMRFAMGMDQFDYVFNLFTSFGYFSEFQLNVEVVNSIHKELKSGGVLVLDYLNVSQVDYSDEGDFVKDGVHFETRKRSDDRFIYKDIHVETAEGESHDFTEQVSRISFTTFMNMLANCGFRVTDVLGDYDLNSFDEKQSPRMIFIAHKE